jgi:Ca2+-binding RTX toxin-like protein
MMRPPIALSVVSALVLTVWVASPANAAVTVSGTNVSGDGSPDFVQVSCAGGVLAASGSATTGDPCATLTFINVDPGGGTDSVDLSGVTSAAFPLLQAIQTNTVDGVADSLTGSPISDSINGDSSDILNGGAGNDLINGGAAVSGGAGDDTVVEFNGTGPVSGGEGDDRFVQFLASGGIDGGPGTDSLEIDFDRVQVAIGTPITLTFSPTGMQITSGVVSGFFPASGLEELDVTLLKDSVQTVDAGTFPGSVILRGVSGVDNLTGGAFDDRILGGTGNDTLTGNGGGDQLGGGDGDDVVNARDGVADRIDCGAGTDTVVADAVDVVTGCETVQLPPVTPPPPPPAVAPDTSTIKGPKSVTKPDKAKYRFSSATAGATFQCKLDKKQWKSCTSPFKVKTAKLSVGKHKLKVRARAGGLTDPTPSKKIFKVTKS